jgi:hypothetical protein
MPKEVNKVVYFALVMEAVKLALTLLLVATSHATSKPHLVQGQIQEF